MRALNPADEATDLVKLVGAQCDGLTYRVPKQQSRLLVNYGFRGVLSELIYVRSEPGRFVFSHCQSRKDVR